MKADKAYILLACHAGWETFCFDNETTWPIAPDVYPCFARRVFDSDGETHYEYLYLANLQTMVWALQNEEARQAQ